MNQKLKFVLALAGLYGVFALTVLLAFAAFWADLNGSEREALLQSISERATLLIFPAAILLMVLGALLKFAFRQYPGAIKRLQEETLLMLRVNPSHRTKPSGGGELRELAETINSLADRHESAKKNVETKIVEAKASLEQEKNRLAALMSELTQSVLVCNIEGRILLYNNRARQLFSRPAEPGVTGTGLVGLGRSIFALIERNLISHSLENIFDRLQQGHANPVANFVTTTEAGRLLRVQMAPVLSRAEGPVPGREGDTTGYVLTLEDITKTIEASGRRDELLQSLTEGSRSALANIRAAVETLLAFPDMEAAHQGKFIQVIGEEVSAISHKLDQVVSEYADALKSQWPLEDMLGADLVAAARRRIEERVGIPTKTEAMEAPLWLKVDSYSFMQALTYLAGRLRDEFAIREVRFRLSNSGKHAQLDLIWSGATVGTATIHTWETEPMRLGGETSPLTLKDVLDRHGGEIWYQAEKASHMSYFRLLLPLSKPDKPAFSIPVSRESRPEYYDFDLFHQPGQTPELDNRLLSELAYTVFDTETTGLQPSQGDEIISVGAVRIVNGRLLQHEVFDQLIDPRRSLSVASMHVHGIQPSMLEGQPTIERVLPAFHQFCEDTVLVAHNAAFDMRFLQMKEGKTGIKFTQPVLDTLLLSAVVHPNQDAHKLEAIAARLGVNVMGRHTALGDAIVTGEIFLKLIPLLAEQDIRTLRQAREAAQKTFYARVNY